MKNQLKRAKKLEKKRKLRKDYERRRNINKQFNSETKEIKKEILRPIHDNNGNLSTDKKGNVIMKVVEKTERKRIKKVIKNKDGEELLNIPFPKSRKNKMNKQEIKNEKIAKNNFIKTITGI